MKLRNNSPCLVALGVGLLVMGVLSLALADTSQESAASIVLPGDPYSFQPGPGSTIASGFCAICHSAEYVYTQPRHPKETWGKIVRKMKSAFGCPIPDDQIPQLVEYLVSQNDIHPALVVEETPKHALSENGSGENIDKGKTVYEKNCANCHGTKGKGDGPIGQALTPPPTDLTATKEKSDQDLLQAIQDGRPGTAMPSWRGDLSAQEMHDVLSYIRSLGQ